VTETQAIQRHIDAVLALPFLDVAAIRARAFPVALDCCHGAGSADHAGAARRPRLHRVVHRHDRRRPLSASRPSRWPRTSAI
jgi:hypothetical protein